jgi:hypothetical protein
VDPALLTKPRVEALIEVAVKLADNAEGKAFLSSYVLEDKLSTRQKELAFLYFKGKSGEVDKDAFEQACGVGAWS